MTIKWMPKSYWLVFFVAIVLSIYGIVRAAKPGRDTRDGGRGGAVAVAVSLFALFLRHDYGTEIYRSLIKIYTLRRTVAKQQGRAVDDNALERVEEELAALSKDIDNNSVGQKRQNLCLALSTCFGTLAWGFGDIAAACWKNL